MARYVLYVTLLPDRLGRDDEYRLKVLLKRLLKKLGMKCEFAKADEEWEVIERKQVAA